MPDPAAVGTNVVPAGHRLPALPAALLRPGSDRRLVEQVRGGSERAFEVLFNRYHPQVLRYCRRILHSDEADDAAQATFVAAYRELLASDAEIELRPWLYAVARHRCLTALRMRRGQPLEEALEPAVDRLVGDVATREDLRAILADVAGLPPDQREALVLAQLGDLPHAEIARSLGCPPSKVKALVFQARRALAAGRAARDTSCADIRAEIATARGAALRRTVLRRHLSECADCRAFRETVRAQRVRLVWPLAPLAALKRELLAVFGTSATGGAGALSGGGLVAAALVTVSIPAAVVAQPARPHGEPPQPAPQRARVAAAAPTTSAAVAVRSVERRPAAVVRRRPAAAVELPGPAARPQAAPKPHSPVRHAPVPAGSPRPTSAAPATVARPLTPPEAHPAQPPAASNGQQRPRPPTPPAASNGHARPHPTKPQLPPTSRPPHSVAPPAPVSGSGSAPPATGHGQGQAEPSPGFTAPSGSPTDHPRGRPSGLGERT